MTSITDTIEALTDERALRVLADTMGYTGRLPDPGALRLIDIHLQEAIAIGGELDSYTEPGDQADSPGDLARATLLYLATSRPELVRVISRAAAFPDDAAKFDPATLAVGALVVLALQTEVKLSRNAQGKWTFAIHKQPIRDSTLGQVISKLIAAYLPGGR